jgi:hypothetical protein
MLRRVALLRTDVSEELSSSFIWMTRIGELGTTLAVTSRLLDGVTSQNTPFFIVIAMKTSSLTCLNILFSNVITGHGVRNTEVTDMSLSCVRFVISTAVTMKYSVF